MASLTGNTVASTYQSLIKIADNSTAGVSLENLTDGLGNETAVWIASQAAAISGSFTVSGSTILSGSVQTVGALTATGGVVGNLTGVASTASYVENARTASYVATALTALSVANLTQTVQLTGSLNITGSLTLDTTGSFILPGSASTSPVAGNFYFDFTQNKIYAYNGTGWVTASLGI